MFSKITQNGYILIAVLIMTLAAGFCFGEGNPLAFKNGGFDDGVNVEISNVDIDNFPGVHLFVRVTDDEGLHIPDLGTPNFEVRENGALVNINIEEHYGYMAVSLVMDQSGSMGGYEEEVIEACNFFVNGLDILDKGAIVKFNQNSWVSVAMTYDKNLMLDSIATYVAGGSTDLWDAINLGISECYYEPEKKAVVTFTDGMDNQPGVYAAQLPGFAGTDITIYTIGIGNIDPDSLIYVAEQTGGFFLPIDDPSQMGQVLNDIREDIGNLYDLFYTTPDPSINGTVRAIEVVCEFQSEVGWDTVSYVAPLLTPPEITLTESTLQLLGVAQNPGTSLYISCDIRSFASIEDARIYYKTTGQQYFSQADLNHGIGSLYHYSIHGSYVQDPGVEFYLQVTDEYGSTVTCPSYNPGYLPLTIPVLPNYAPTITYYFPPEVWLTRRTLPIEVVVEDNTSVTGVSLFYRVPGTFFYYEDPMDYLGDNIYKVIIEGPQLNEEDDLEMFIAAWDDDGVVNYWYLSEDPFYLNVVPELPPTPPAVALEPVSVPIIIPAAGGSFDYTMYVINPVPDSGYCDVWADLVLPDGSIQALEMVIEDIELEGGESFIEGYTQEVPDTAASGEYLFRMHTGDYSTLEEYFTASFSFMKVETMTGIHIYNNGWRWYPIGSQPYEFSEPVLICADQPALSSGWPNPFNSSTRLEFFVPNGGRLSLVIHNVYGEEIARLADGYYPAGVFEVYWDAANIASGVYFCRLVTQKSTITTKLMLIK